MSFLLLRRSSELPAGKSYEYLKSELSARSLQFSEEVSVNAILTKYETDPANTQVYVDFPIASIEDFERLRKVKVFTTHSCRFEMQRSRERIFEQRIREITISGASLHKCISMCNYISDFDSFVELNSLADNHLSGRLAKSGAHVSIELTNQESAGTSYRYCVTTESENFCFMVLNDAPYKEQVHKQINDFITGALNLAQYAEGTNPYFLRSLDIMKTHEIAQLALTNKSLFKLKPRNVPSLYETNSANHINNNNSSNTTTNPHQNNRRIEFCTTGAAAINQEALFDPLKKLDTAVLSAFFASNPKSQATLFKQTLCEDAILFTNLAELAQNFKGIAYVPSLPGKRKADEMAAFCETNSIVLAEKPGFANAQAAIDFEKSVSKDKLENLFFGWHYIHHPSIQDVVTRVQSKEFGEISRIKAYFTRPKQYSKSGRIFDPFQGGCGLDRFCYPLHFALTLAKEHTNSFEVLSASHKNYGEIYNLLEGDVAKNIIDLEGTLQANIRLNGKVEAELFSSMETEENHHSQARISFEDGTEIVVNWFVHPHVAVRDFSLYCSAIRRKGQKGFSPLNLINPAFDKNLSSYDYQIRAMIKQQQESQMIHSNSTLNNNNNNNNVNQQSSSQKAESITNLIDPLNLSLTSNIYLQQVLDAIFIAAGLPVKLGL